MKDQKNIRRISLKTKFASASMILAGFFLYKILEADYSASTLASDSPAAC